MTSECRRTIDGSMWKTMWVKTDSSGIPVLPAELEEISAASTSAADVATTTAAAPPPSASFAASLSSALGPLQKSIDQIGPKLDMLVSTNKGPLPTLAATVEATTAASAAPPPSTSDAALLASALGPLQRSIDQLGSKLEAAASPCSVPTAEVAATPLPSVAVNQEARDWTKALIKKGSLRKQWPWRKAASFALPDFERFLRSVVTIWVLMAWVSCKVFCGRPLAPSRTFSAALGPPSRKPRAVSTASGCRPKQSKGDGAAPGAAPRAAERFGITAHAI